MSHYRKKNNQGFTPTPISQKIGVNSRSERGFTLLELIISIGIVAVILTVVVSNQSTYTDGAATFSLLTFGSNTAYLYFADRNGDEYYNGDWSCPIGGASECLEKVDILRGNYIEDICALRTSGTDLCNLGRVDISFARPNIEAVIHFFNNGGEFYNPANIKAAEIRLKSPGGAARSVIVYTTGQISVQ
ncbi:MAG: type II secretion system protein [Candidatus Zambryskibacteria bacterium]|nr:type II secretion system protein [Candidatus Zambryskibacteria bacterium]